MEVAEGLNADKDQFVDIGIETHYTESYYAAEYLADEEARLGMYKDMALNLKHSRVAQVRHNTQTDPRDYL